MEKEIWKDILGYEGLYEISSNGRVKSLARTIVDSLGRCRPYPEKILVNRISKQTGYPCVNLTKDGNVKTHNIHKLIADAFIPNPDNLPCINHIDENRQNSVLSNLERCTYGYNTMYGSAPQKRRESLRKHYEEYGKPIKGIQYGTNLSVNQYTLDGKLINHFKGGCPEIQEKLGYNKNNIGTCCRHNSSQAYGYVWRYEGDNTPYEKPRYNTGKDFSNCKKKKHQKYVIMINENGDVIEKFKSVSEAGEKCGFDRHLFSRTKPIDGITEIKGFRFIVEKKENEYIPKGHKGPRPDLKYKSSKAVCQYSKDGEFIAEYKSMKDAAAAMGNVKYAPEISNCCNGNLKTARGFIWRKKGEPAPQPFVNDILRKIEQYTTDGKYVNTYESISEAAKALNARAGSINNNLRGISNSAYGFIWKYAK